MLPYKTRSQKFQEIYNENPSFEEENPMITTGKGLLTEKEQANHMKKIILGQMKAGNNHPQLKVSLKNINNFLKQKM